MEINNKIALISRYAGHVKPDNLLVIASSLDALEDNKANALISLPLKNPLLTLIFSVAFGFFAIDRFYLGQVGLGIVKLVMAGLVFGASWFVLDMIWYIFCIWWVVDWFLTYRVAHNINLEKITEALHLSKS